ncbi:MAG: oxygen-insensitive NAD(P)H nitroreductase [Cardiobacteriaceae bacterium]|nr:oxygen-insensitive NAD(P)H nitroreductase [Cardiobacteriaceae bacterium]
MNIEMITAKRYATKKFNPDKKIPTADFAQILAAIRNSPSGVNIQPWHIIIADDAAGKARIAKSAAAFPPNLAKIRDASHVAVFAALTHADEAHMAAILTQETIDGRYPDAERRQNADIVRHAYLTLHRDTLHDEEAWLAQQVHISLGFALFAAAALGIDAVPMAPADIAILNDEFALVQKGYNAVAIVAFGYRADDDYNAALPKSRLPETLIFSKA